MKLNKNILLLGLAALPLAASAQKAGDLIRGNVSDDVDALMACNVVEIDNANRIVAHAVTDVNGNFSFRIVDPKHKLRISYIGYATQTIPIKGLVYKIKMKDSNTLTEVVVKGKQVTQASGLAIPLREISSAQQVIDAKEFEGLAFTSIDEALQGRIAGLDIVSNSGNLGSGTTMRLRGVSSIHGSSEPLIVVDGNVFESENKAGFDYTGATEEQFSELLNVNPDDIASITVLKDAGATALYGSQGANGVIEIKTKRGTRGKTRVQYTYRATVTHQPYGYKLLNGDQYTMLMKEEYFNPSLSDAASDIREFNYDPSFSEYEMYNNNTDWKKQVQQTGLLQKHNINLSGGGEKATFRISVGYDHQTGTVIKQKYDRFSTRVAFDYNVSDRIKIVTNFNMTYQQNQMNYNKGGDLIAIAMQKMPNLSVYEQDQYGNDTKNYYHMLANCSPELRNDQLTYVNPLALAYEAKNTRESYQIQPEFQIQYNLLGTQADETRLRYEGKIFFNINNNYSDQFYPSSLVTSGWSSSDNNRASNSADKSTGISTTHTLTFEPHFKNEAHSLMIMGRFQLNDNSSKNSSNGVFGLPYGAINSPIANGIINALGSGAGQGRSIYLTSQIHYSYQSKYSATFTVRRDGTTKFGDDRRWGTFPALSLRWNVSDEPWMERVKWLSMLSIRPGWGISGNPPGSEYLYFSRYGTGPAYNEHGSVVPQNIRLNTIQWENKETYNIGFDLGFFDDKLQADFNIYRNLTTKLLMPGVKIPASSGFPSLSWMNVGDMRNIGWEFNITTKNLLRRNKTNVDFNISFANNKNEITKMDPTVLQQQNKDFNRSNGNYLTRIQLYNAFGSIYGFRYKGVYQYSKYTPTEVPGVSGPNAPVARDAAGNVIVDKDGLTVPMVFCYQNNENTTGGTAIYEFKGGDAIYEDINHDGNINELDIVYLGSSLPKVTGGWGFRVNFGRGFQWNNQFNFRVGNKIINAARMGLEKMYDNTNQSVAVNWRWRVEGDIAPIPRALYKEGYNWLGSDRFMEDGSFMRLKNTQLSYNFDAKKLKKYGLSSLRLDLTGNNLLLFTRYSGADPEVSYGGMGVAQDNSRTPNAKSVTFGLTVGF